MNLLAVVVTHDRWGYTDKCLNGLLGGLWSDDRFVLVDNASTDETRDKLGIFVDDALVLNDRNLFPGAACNIGWQHGLSSFKADLLMRLDNDIELLPGWRDHVEKAFTLFPTLGQLGILNMWEDYGGEANVPVKEWNSEGDGQIDPDGYTLNVNSPWTGGNCVIRRELWDEGLRWDSNPWRPGKNEDTLMSQAIHDLGWKVARVIPTVANNLSYHAFDAYPDYYRFTASLRGLVPELSV